MNILILSIYNETPIYKNMLEIQKKYINNNKNIDYYFVTFKSEQTEDVVIESNFIFIKGIECLLNITDKTIKCLKHLLKIKNYDFIIRTNISTVIHFNNLIKFLNTLPKYDVYLGGTLEILNWYDHKSGINKESCEKYNLIGLKYIQGTSIILSNDIANYIVDNENLINYQIVDDVTIGLFIRENKPNIYSNLSKEICCNVNMNNFENNFIFLRNNKFDSDRKNDIERIEKTINYLIAYDNILKNNYFPKTIHLVHKNLHLLEKSYKQWCELNPEYSIELYDDDRCKKILLEEYGQLYLDIFNFIKDGPIKCDFFRLCILYLKGGIYVDADIKPLVSLKEFIEDDIDFATCISYNYKSYKNTFIYNPHFLLAKKYDEYLYKTINKYIEYYINKVEYSYWNYSICTLMEKIDDFTIEKDSNNIFIKNNKKYKFIIESLIVKSTNEYYDFFNFNYNDFTNKYKNNDIDVFCHSKNIKVFENFTNK